MASLFVCGGLACGRTDLGGTGAASTADAARDALADAGLASDVARVADAAQGVLADVAGPMIRLDVARDLRSGVCGNGRLEYGEECDDWNTLPGDGCAANCKVECNWLGCPDAALTVVVCGDGLVQAFETCDDANVTDGDGCSRSCAVERGFSCPVPGRRCVPVCGDRIVAGLETCDDGNTTAGDGCSPFCLVEECWDCSRGPCRLQPPGLDAGTCPRPPTTSCGNGRVEGAEECDEGADNDDRAYGGCSTRCRHLRCGDGIVSDAEECDDGIAGNTALYGDRTGCTPACARPHYCGDGFIDTAFGESCDHGDRNGSGACTSTCVVWLP